MSCFCPFFVFRFYISYAPVIHILFTYLRESLLLSNHTLIMSKITKQSEIHIARKITSSNTRKWKIYPYSNESRINLIKDRWLYVKTQEVISDLTQILIFTKKIERSWTEHLEVCDQVSDLLTKLQWEKRDRRYMQVVQVITKYLEGIRKFISRKEIKGVLSYRAIFESTIIAIRRELDYIEKEAY